jgi:ABC-type multidrug transport system fused ATPase/permease subunit
MVFFAFLLIVIAWFIYFKKSIYLKLCFTFLIIVIPFLLIYYIYSILDKYTEIKPVNFSKLATHSANGTPYLHDTVNFGIENGRYVGLYIAEKELRETWNRRSTLDYDGKDLKNQQLKFTLIRYLSSRNLNKDSVGITQLTSAEIHYIEKGIANTNYLENFGLKTRVIQAYQGLENYYTTGDPSANSFAQRLEYWKASIALIKTHFFTGVGTGDMNEAFIQQYEKMHSQLNYKFRRRSHNQFFSVFVAFGVIGFSWFCFTLLYPVIVHKKWNDYLYMLFFFTAILSMLVEDTIETQAGVTFFAFFNAFFLFCTKKE